MGNFLLSRVAFMLLQPWIPYRVWPTPYVLEWGGSVWLAQACTRRHQYSM
jgi:hypothetical protein